MSTKIYFFDVQEYEEQFLKENIPTQCDYKLYPNPFHEIVETNPESINDAEILCVFTSSRIKAAHLESFKNLKLIATRSTGFSHIDTEYCKNSGITVVNVPKYGDCTVAEFAFALLLNVVRKVDIAHENLRRGHINTHQYVGLDLNNKTIGIIGTGAIGAHAVKIATGFCMKVIAYDPYPKQELVEKYGVQYVELEELYKNSDFISIHAPSTKANFHMINEQAFNQMKKGVVIVNTARGEIIDTEALYKAIHKGIVAGAGLDVLECEEILAMEDDYLTKIDCIHPECLSRTLLNHKLLELPNVIVTPHIAFDTTEAIHRILNTTIENIISYLNSNTINQVN